MHKIESAIFEGKWDEQIYIYIYTYIYMLIYDWRPIRITNSNKMSDISSILGWSRCFAPYPWYHYNGIGYETIFFFLPFLNLINIIKLFPFNFPF